MLEYAQLGDILSITNISTKHMYANQALCKCYKMPDTAN